MLENNKIKGGLFGLLPGGKGFSQLAQEMARMAGEFYTGVPLFVVNTLSSVAGYNNFIGNDGAHYTRLDAVNDWFGKMSGYNLVGATPLCFNDPLNTIKRSGLKEHTFVASLFSS